VVALRGHRRLGVEPFEYVSIVHKCELVIIRVQQDLVPVGHDARIEQVELPPRGEQLNGLLTVGGDNNAVVAVERSGNQLPLRGFIIHDQDGHFLFSHGLHRFPRNTDGAKGSTAGTIRQGDHATHGLQDLPGYRQPQTGATGLRGDEGLEQLFWIPFTQAGSLVFNFGRQLL
jgi:hypothetical protein